MFSGTKVVLNPVKGVNIQLTKSVPHGPVTAVRTELCLVGYSCLLAGKTVPRDKSRIFLTYRVHYKRTIWLRQ